MTDQQLLHRRTDGIVILTLNNPDRRNALSSVMLAELKAALDRIKEDSTVRVVILRSQGPVFSSGHDLRELVNGDAESYAGVFAACTSVMEAIRLLPQPVIAEVQGLATAAGCQLVATCDLAIASDTASFATPGGADRPVLHYSRRGRVPRRPQQEGLGDVTNRPPGPSQRGGGIRSHQPGRARRETGGGGDDAGSSDKRRQRLHRCAGQGGFPPAAGDGHTSSLRNGREGDGGEPAGRRRQRGHHGLSGKAHPKLDNLTGPDL